MTTTFPWKMSAGLALVVTAAFSQTPGPALTFDVASIKPAPPITPAMVQSGQLHVGMKVDAARVDIGYLSLADLIAVAYKVKSYQISGPDWMGAQRFDVLAKMPEGATKEQVPEMLQALLAERFKLTIHRDTKENSVYAMVVGKNGPKMKESPPDTDVADKQNGDGGPSSGPGGSAGGPSSAGDSKPTVRLSGSMEGKGMAVSTGQGTGTMHMSMGPDGKSMHMENSKVTMAQFAEMITRFVDRPVVDMTELKGNYQIALDLSMDEMMSIARKSGAMVPMGAGGDAGRSPADAASDPSGSSIFASVQQLGLKLDPRKTQVDHIVVEHLEKLPTEN